MSFINKIGIAKAPFKMEQKLVSGFMQNFYNITDIEKRKIGLMYERCGIDYRYSAIPDYDRQNKNNELIDPTPEKIVASVEKRMELYFKNAPKMCKTAIYDCLTKNRSQLAEITHLITVSCTGIAAPGLDLILLEELGLSSNIHRSSVNFMGCYAVFHALKIADAFCKLDKKNKVVVVSVELCTLHFQNDFSMENVAANLLFADGAAACIVSSEKEFESAIQLNTFFSQVLFKGKQDMAWHVSNTGFLMTLSSYIPSLIESGIGELLGAVLEKAGIQKTEIKNWAIHPGGKKIIEAVKKELNLHEEDVKVSTEILRNYGNMSSATILFVLQQMQSEKRKGKVFACGFGPGITIESLVAEMI